MKHARIGILAFALAATAAPSALAAPPAQKSAKKPRSTPAAKRPPKRAAAPVETPAPDQEESLPPREPERRPAPSAPTLTRPSSTEKDAPSAEPDDEPETPKPISIAPVLGYATTSLNLGVGIRGGYTLPNRVYIGGTFVFHLGTSDQSETAAGKIESSARFVYTGAEGGYDIPVGPVVIRPYGGIGAIVALVSLSSGGESQSDSSTSLAFWPGCTVTYAIPRSSFFVGGDSRIVIATKGGDPSFGMFGTGGMRF